MKCPRCGVELGANKICICSILDSENNSNNQSTNENYYDYNENSYYNNQSINNTTEQSYRIYDAIDSNNISREEFADFIGTNNTHYYLKYLPEMKNNSNFLSWNWSCFFLGSYWLLYRKLYLFFSIFMILNRVSSRLSEGFSIIFMLTIHILISIFTNSIYLKDCENKIKIIKATTGSLSTSEYINKLQKKRWN